MNNIHHHTCFVIPPHILRRAGAEETLEQMRELTSARTAQALIAANTPNTAPATPPPSDGIASPAPTPPSVNGVLAAVGIRAGDRLFVHIGSVAYRGAVVIASCRGEEKTGIRHFAARILEFESQEHGHLMRVAEGSAGLMLAEPGAVQVECVIIRHLLSIVLRRLGIPHDSVADGHSALELMREHHYDVLLLDLMMPVISGYELIEHLKQDAQRPCTIIVMSAVSEADLARLDPEIVTNVVHKPFDVDAVAALVRDAARACVHS